jgi:TRAP-type C4-dicarboxylate transport system permease small subunit
MKKKIEIFFGLLLLAAVLVSFSEIIMRVLFYVSYDVIIDLPVWIIVWAALLTAGPILLENDHISIDILRDRFTGKARLFVEITNAIACLVFGVVMLFGGIQFVFQLYQRKAVFPRYIPVPMWLVELCVPIGMLLFSIFSVVLIVNVLKKKW